MNVVKQLIPDGSPGSDDRDVVPFVREIADVGVSWRDLTTGDIVLDTNAQRLFGYNVGEYKFKTFQQHLRLHSPVPLDDDVRMAVATFEASPNGALGDATKRVRQIAKADGELTWLLIIACTLKAHDGRPYVLEALRDVTAEVEVYIALSRAKVELEATKHLFRTATQSSEVGLWRVNPSTGEAWFSDSWFTMLGYEPDEFAHTAASFFALVHPDDLARVNEGVEEAMAHPDGKYAGDFRLLAKDGRYIWIGSSGQIFEDPATGATIMTGTQLDISGRVSDKREIQKTADAAKRTLARLINLAENVPGGLYELVVSTDGVMSFPYLSEGFANLVGHSVAQIKANPALPYQHVVAEDAERIRVATGVSMAELTEFKEVYRLEHPQRGLQYLRGSSTPFRQPDGSTRWYGCLMDVTEEVLRENDLEKARARTEQQALRDALTGMPNRRDFDVQLSRLHAAAKDVPRRQTLVRIDLDRFKLINDRMGHSTGDAVLCKMAEYLEAATTGGDRPARVGGDEFVVILAPGKDIEDALDLIHNLQGAIRAPFSFEGRQCSFDASFGVASSPDFQEDAETLLNFADAALYEAKAAGRGRTEVFTPALHAQMVKTKERLIQIQDGIEREEFVPYFQPQIDAATGALVGCEVLARWIRPQEGLIVPDDFLPVAEMMNVVQDIDRLVFERALSTFHRFNAHGLRLPKMSFNVSIGRILDPEMIERLGQVDLTETPIAFELLESILMEEEGALFSQHIDALKKRGVEIEVDDFGSGRASIIGVMRVSPNSLKIDKRLVMPMVQDTSMHGLVRAIVDIGRTLGIGVVAEGVETMQHAELLRRMGCHALQGYAFSRPLAEDAFAHYLGAFQAGQWFDDDAQVIQQVPLGR